MAKKSKGKKISGRIMPIYPRVQLQSHRWLSKAVGITGKSQSEIVDFLLWRVANKHITPQSISNFLGHAKEA